MSVSSVSWRDFERLIVEAFRQRGFSVTGFGGTRPRGGVDLALSREGARFLVHCKHWNKPEVGITVIRELSETIGAIGAQGAYVVTGGQFTSAAVEFARSKPILLIDDDSLKELLGPSPDAGVPLPAHALPEDAHPPVCPKCGALMSKRQKSRGWIASLWGCEQSPDCGAIVKIAGAAIR